MDVIIFDLDGTLIDSRADILAAFHHAFTALGMDTPPADRLLMTIGMRLEDCFLPFVGGRPEEADRAAGFFRAWYKTHFLDSTRPFPGVEAMLDRLSGRYRLAVCTMKKAFFARKIVRAFNWDRVFHEVVGSEEGFAPKPDPAMLLEICRRMAVPPERASYIGDTSTDGTTAANAGMPFYFAGYGYGELAARTGEEPRQVLKAPADLADLLA